MPYYNRADINKVLDKVRNKSKIRTKTVKIARVREPS